LMVTVGLRPQAPWPKQRASGRGGEDGPLYQARERGARLPLGLLHSGQNL
jgi:hypothetical protein